MGNFDIDSNPGQVTLVYASPLGAVYRDAYDGNSIYHALVAKVEKRLSKGLTILGSYTFSKTIGDTCGESLDGNAVGCGFQNIFNLRAERSLDNQDVPHRFVASVLYDIPVGKGRMALAHAPRAVDAIVGGWTIGSIVSDTSDVPYSVTVSGNPANTGTYTVVQRPNVVGDPNQGTRTLQQDFNTAAFAVPAAYTYGSAGRNILRGRRQFTWDFSALKYFDLAERLKMQFRFEAFTLTNTPRFNSPGNVLGTASFGVITGAGTPRNLQFGLKLIW